MTQELNLEGLRNGRRKALKITFTSSVRKKKSKIVSLFRLLQSMTPHSAKQIKHKNFKRSTPFYSTNVGLEAIETNDNMTSSCGDSGEEIKRQLNHSPFNATPFLHLTNVATLILFK